MTNILIGVGGTGAKIVEAALVMLAAGLGPKQLHVGLVDQDSSNGNVARTKTLITAYREFRELWQNGSPANTIDWKGDGKGDDGFAFCRTDVSELFDQEALWCPGGDQSSLSAMIGQNLSESQKHLFDLLFMPGPEEQDLSLDEGYRGRAHVGAAALISRLTDPRNPLTARMTELMSGGGGRERVNIFIVGSAFGGTGAAGFPTIAREFHRIRSAQEFSNKGQVAIGGALMLPYFGFAPPEEQDKSKVVTTDELLPKAQLALEHYGNLFESERTFDRFYLVGWDRFFQLGYHEAGNIEQRNPPLLPELFGASAAIHFLNRSDEEPIEESGPVPVLISARDGRHVRWSDLPVAEAEARLGQLFRFAVYWRYAVAELLAERQPWFGKGNWAHQLSGKASREEAMEALMALDSLLDKILVFGAALEQCAPNDWDIGLWRFAALQQPGYRGSPTEPARLVASHPESTGIFSDLIRRNDGSPVERDAAVIYDDLENKHSELAKGAHSGFGRVVAATFQAAKLR
jgi:hypothetical protein